MTEHPAAIGVDVGGTKMITATVAADGSLVSRVRSATPAPTGRDGGEDALVAAVVAGVTTVGADVPVGLGVAGLVDRDGHVAYAPNLAIRDVDLGARLATALGREVTVANDATVAGVAEHRLGAARGHDHVVMVTVGTGIGGSVLVDGRPLFGAHGHGSELGHQVVEVNGPMCACGSRGCLEALASGTALTREARDGLADLDVSSSLRGAGDLTGRDVTDAASAGDAYAIRVLERVGWWLGLGLAGLVNVFDPSVVVIGGGVTDGARDWLLPAARAAMEERVLGREHRRLPAVVPAELGDDAGVIGAALLAMEANP